MGSPHKDKEVSAFIKKNCHNCMITNYYSKVGDLIEVHVVPTVSPTTGLNYTQEMVWKVNQETKLRSELVNWDLAIATIDSKFTYVLIKNNPE